MPIKKNIADKPLPANKQKGKKKCSCCGTEKPLVDFYASANPLYSSDKRVPICKNCIRDLCIDKDTNIIDEVKLNHVLKSVQKPYFKDDLASAYSQFAKEHSYVDDENIKKFGDKVLGLYFKNTMLRQNKDLSYDDSEKLNFVHSNSNITVAEKNEILQKYSDINIRNTEEKEKVIRKRAGANFEVTDEIIELFGDGYTPSEYKKMLKKYEDMSKTYVVQTNLHKEALLTYVRFKVKEEIATANGDVVEAAKWYQAAQDAAEKAKLTPRQLSKEDLQGGVANFGDIFTMVEGQKERISIFPEFRYQPKDSADFIIWCYVNYERKLNNMPEASYKDIYAFYDKKKEEYIEQYGDPYGIFTNDTTESNRETISKFITIPPEFRGDE